jgi:hypothetical protein
LLFVLSFSLSLSLGLGCWLCAPVLPTPMATFPTYPCRHSSRVVLNVNLNTILNLNIINLIYLLSSLILCLLVDCIALSYLLLCLVVMCCCVCVFVMLLCCLYVVVVCVSMCCCLLCMYVFVYVSVCLVVVQLTRYVCTVCLPAALYTSVYCYHVYHVENNIDYVNATILWLLLMYVLCVCMYVILSILLCAWHSSTPHPCPTTPLPMYYVCMLMYIMYWLLMCYVLFVYCVLFCYSLHVCPLLVVGCCLVLVASSVALDGCHSVLHHYLVLGFAIRFRLLCCCANFSANAIVA